MSKQDYLSKYEQQFAESITRHEMTVLRDDGAYRHLRFRQPDSINRWFDLVTWPGYLAIVGDMGDDVFSREKDMFGWARKPEGSRIDYDYWAEKLVAVSRYGGPTEPSSEKLRARIIEEFKEAIRYTDKEYRKELKAQVRDVLDFLERNKDEHGIQEAVEDLMRIQVGRREPFQDFYECNYKRFTFYYVWRCNAILWGIRRYYEWKGREAGASGVAGAAETVGVTEEGGKQS